MIGRKDIAIILLAVMTILALGGPSVMANTSTTNTADEATFTGCLKNGKLESVAIGDSPLEPCGDNAQEVSWNAQGPAGEDGATWFSGATLPTSDLGTNGDLYLHLDTGDVFVKQYGTWVTHANLEGP